VPTAYPFAGATGPVDSTDWTKLIETAYDREVSYYLREQVAFRDMIDVKPKRQAMPGDIVVLTRHKDLDVSLAPLSETLTPDPLAVKDPDRIQIAIEEYGDFAVDTVRLNALAFTQPRKELVTLLGRLQHDKIDGLVKQVMDTGTNTLFAGDATSDATVDATDVSNADLFLEARTRMRRNHVPFRDGSSYVTYAHPDVTFDIMKDENWKNPGEYVAPDRLYNAEVGRWAGFRFVESTRCAPVANVGGVDVYPTYAFGKEALVEVTPREFGTVVGPVVDPLNRFHPVGFYGIWGAAVYRQDALLRISSASTYSAG
jgi:N4-gp56 family major capsid protein